MSEEKVVEIESPGTRVAHYEILELVGQGGMGVVYRARDINLGRQVALKRPLVPLLASQRTRDRFRREAQAASRLQHPSIVTIFEVFESNGYDWMAMEFVDGRSLGEALRHDGPLTPRELVRHAEGLADALREAHDHHVIHRDIKPSNILVDRKGLARLTDFGLARFHESAEDVGGDTTQSMPLTEIGKIVGTAAYMSPEQALGQEVDERTDIFSLGVVLHEMCTAHPAFAQKSKGRILDAILHHEPRPIPSFNAKIGNEVIRIITKCMAKRADERYQSAEELLTDLRAERRRIQGSDYATSHPHEVVTPQTRNKMMPVVVGVAALAIVGVAAYLGFRSSGSTLSEFTPRQITAQPGWESDVAISPDGGFLAYASNQSGNADIWVMDVRGGNALQLTSDPGPDRRPSWFPDGSAIVFDSERESGTGIWRVPRLGGTPSMLIADGFGPAISPDGTRLAFVQRIDAEDTRIAVANLDDLSQVETLTNPGDGVWIRENPAWSPDGKWICYNGFRDLWLVPADGGEVKRLTTDAAGNWEPTWSPDGRFIYFSSGREDTVALWRVRANGSEPQRITVGTGPEVFPSISGDGSILAYSTFRQELDPVLVDLQSRRSTRIRGARVDWGGRFAPDNSGFVFVSDRAGSGALWWLALNAGLPAGDPVQINHEKGESSNPEISPDGRWVAYQQRFGRDARISVVPLPAGPPRALTEGPGLFIHPAWSPDGSELAFLTEHDDFSDLWVGSVAEGQLKGAPRRIDTGHRNLFWPQWSPDGRVLAVIAATGESWDVWKIGAEGSSEPRQLTTEGDVLQILWDHDSNAILASGFWGEQEISVRRVDPETGAVEPLGWPIEFGHTAVYGDFDVSRDSSLVLYTIEEVEGDLWVLEGSNGAF